jgi:sigma-54 dependent transcriptional regulator, acetoin dehydrogenase operon transcriptional activator AcoR
VLIVSPASGGEHLPPASPPTEPALTRILALRRGRLVLLSPPEIRFARADGNTVWITTDHDQLRAFSRGLVALEEKVRGHGFLRVNRNFLVNLARVREIAPSFKGGFALVMNGSPEEVVPVSRRHAAEVRRLLGL